MLAAAACVFTVLLEAGWTWGRHGYEPSGTLAGNFSLELGIPPAWQVLALGLLIAIAAFARQALQPGAAVDRKVG
jgi:hypothetical protein